MVRWMSLDAAPVLLTSAVVELVAAEHVLAAHIAQQFKP
jgi:hypothetical protein